ncbi:MAG: capsid cement protein [Pseudomonadota bacterium]
MATNFIQEGKRLTITAGAEIKSGDLVLVGSLAAVALADIALAAKGSAATEGAWELAGKDTAVAIAQGEKVYRVTADGKLTNVSADASYIGIAWEAAAQAATTVMVKINA